MASEHVLFEAGVLGHDGGEVALNDEFARTVETHKTTFEGCSATELEAEIRDDEFNEAIIEPLAALGESDPQSVAELWALTEYLENAEDALQLLPSLRLFRSGDIRSDGAPESFIPVPGTHLPYLLEIYSPALVYVWLADSESCELAKRDLEEVFEEQQNVMPFAVYGPEYKQFLEQEYDLSAGPAILFTRNGTVEARLYGAHGPATIEAELRRHRGSP